ncbi:MAG: SBBP repeat-containing protein, partial [Acidobacteria bacterium]|nr:SBBP repeat-containing protein [Acidobacteriota bacterium]
KEVGGSGTDVGRATAMDAQGNVYIFGSAGSPDFPTTTNAVQPASGGGTDLFVLKLNKNGDVLFSTYLGGSGTEGAGGIQLDKDGNIYLTGSTSSLNFPVSADALQRTSGGATDSYLVKLDPTGSRILYSSYLGGSANEVGNAVALDTAGNVYLAGWTSSSNFQTKGSGG